MIDQVNFNINIYTNKLFYYTDLLPSTNLLELLVISHSSSERRNIFVLWWMKLAATFAAQDLFLFNIDCGITNLNNSAKLHVRYETITV